MLFGTGTKGEQLMNLTTLCVTNTKLSLSDVLRRLCHDFNYILLGWDDPLFQISILAFNQIAPLAVDVIERQHASSSIRFKDADPAVLVAVERFN